MSKTYLIAIFLVSVCSARVSAQTGIRPFAGPLEFGFSRIPYVSPENLNEFMLDEKAEPQAVKEICARIAERFRRYSWESDPCGSLPWKASLKTRAGNPLLYVSFGKGPETTLIISSVHPDEFTPVPMGFRFAHYLENHPELYLKNARVVIAPLVNPDAFLRNRPTRQNANGVDLNRNFFTIDWYGSAGDIWRKKASADPRYYPGYFPNSEIETLFQIQLIDLFLPDKILSFHAPLGFYDYDGPGDRKHSFMQNEERARQLIHAVSRKSQDYRIVDYSFYPGSLGNYAGNERNIATVTLELETTNPSKVDRYWRQFLPGLVELVQYRFRTDRFRNVQNATDFFDHYREANRQGLHNSAKNSL